MTVAAHAPLSYESGPPDSRRPVFLYVNISMVNVVGGSSIYLRPKRRPPPLSSSLDGRGSGGG